MTTFTVWRYQDAERADQAVSVLKDAESEGLVKIVDHAVVSWPQGASQPHTTHSHDDTKRGAGYGALWGILGGALFTVPIIGGVVGASLVALSRATQGTGISKEDLEKIRTGITEGTSALFLVTENADVDRLGERMRGFGTELVTTNLTDEERSVLMETFGSGGSS